nr:hypothetical protein [Angustibacter aerolatus]
MKETPLDVDRTYVEFVDPGGADDDEQQVFRCDLTWLTSSWTCVFGSGCKGIYADRPDDGCCTLGAHFTEQSDVDNVTRAVALLTPETWQPHPDAQTDGWTEEEDGDTKTRVVDGACIFLNRKGFAGGYGCAFHHEAARQGVAFHTLKPEVCWRRRCGAPTGRSSGPTAPSTSRPPSASTTGAAGAPAATTSTGTARATPRPTSARCRCSGAARASLRDLMGDAAYEPAGTALRGAPRAGGGGPRHGGRAPAVAAAGAPRDAEGRAEGRAARGPAGLTTVALPGVVPSPNTWRFPDVYEPREPVARRRRRARAGDARGARLDRPGGGRRRLRRRVPPAGPRPARRPSRRRRAAPAAAVAGAGPRAARRADRRRGAVGHRAGPAAARRVGRRGGGAARLLLRAGLRAGAGRAWPGCSAAAAPPS